MAKSEFATTLLQQLCRGSDNHIDSRIVERIKELLAADHIWANDIHGILDDCVRYSLASKFVIIALDALWADLLRMEGAITKLEAISMKHGEVLD